MILKLGWKSKTYFDIFYTLYTLTDKNVNMLLSILILTDDRKQTIEHLKKT